MLGILGENKPVSESLLSGEGPLLLTPFSSLELPGSIFSPTSISISWFCPIFNPWEASVFFVTFSAWWGNWAKLGDLVWSGCVKVSSAKANHSRCVGRCQPISARPQTKTQTQALRKFPPILSVNRRWSLQPNKNEQSLRLWKIYSGSPIFAPQFFALYTYFR